MNTSSWNTMFEFEHQAFSVKGVLEDLEDATKFVLMMTEGT